MTQYEPKNHQNVKLYFCLSNLNNKNADQNITGTRLVHKHVVVLMYIQDNDMLYTLTYKIHIIYLLIYYYDKLYIVLFFFYFL